MKPSGPGKRKEYRADRIMRMTFARVSVAGPSPRGGRKRKPKPVPKITAPRPKWAGGGKRRYRKGKR